MGIGKYVLCPKGHAVFNEGETGNVMYVLVEGCVELRKKTEKAEAVLKTVDTPNEFFGEMALIDGRPRSASAVATVETKLLAVDSEAFDTLIEQNGKFALRIIKVLSERIRNSNIKISDLIDTDAEERLVRGIADYATRYGEKVFDGGYKMGLAEIREWMNTRLGIALDDFDSLLSALFKRGDAKWARTSVKGRESVIVTDAFVSSYDRRLR